MGLNMDATGLLTAIGVIMGNIVTIITLYIHLDNKTEKILNGMREEIKDFHSRLISLEERVAKEKAKKVLGEMAERQV